MPSRCNLFFILFLTSFFIDFYPNLAPTWPQLGPQIHPKTHPRPILERKSEKNPTKMGPKLITFNQHEPKDPQSRPRTPPCTSFSLIFDRFLMDFWYYFHCLLLDFSLIFDPILIDAFMFLIGFWSPTCIIFSSITRNSNNSSKYFKNVAYDNPLCRMSHRSPKARLWKDSGTHFVSFLNRRRSPHPTLPNEPPVAEGEGWRCLAAGIFNR